MITLKSEAEVKLMAEAGRISKNALVLAGKLIRPEVTTEEVDSAVEAFIRKCGAVPSFLGYHGFPKSTCISIGDTVIHGIPDRTVIKEGDIVSVDVGAQYKGYHGDNAATFAVGEVSEEAKRLIAVTRRCFYEALKFCKVGYRIGDVSSAVQYYAEQHGFSVVREFVGHGIGTQMHEAPEVPNFGTPARGTRLQAGMTLAIEPMVNAGGAPIHVLDDGWTVKTRDGSLSAHYENTIFITDGEPVILTAGDEDL